MIDSGPKQPENRIHLFDPVGLINEKYAHYGVRPRQATSSYEGFTGTNNNNTNNNGGGGGGLRFTVEPKAADSDSGGSSPRLWKNNSNNNSPPTSPRFTSSPPHQLRNPSCHHHQNPESMSPNSRIQAIARGRRELMEMIKDMPESYYELSLRDIVDQKPPPSPPPPAAVEQHQPLHEETEKQAEVVEKKYLHQEEEEAIEAPKERKQGKRQKKGGKKVGKSESKKKMVRSKSVVDNGGFLLKTTVFPIPFRSRKRKKSRSLSIAPSFKVSQNPTPKGSVKGSEKHWWGRKSRVSSETESGGLTSESVRSSASTSRSSSIVSRHRQSNRFLPSCCSFFNEKKIKAKK